MHNFRVQSDVKDQQQDEDSEYGHNYKKKLHKELFNGSQDTTEKPQKASKRKNTYAQSDSDDYEVVPKKKIKSEPSDKHHQKKSQKAAFNNQDTSDEERYLNVKVKEENDLVGSETRQVYNEEKEEDSTYKNIESGLKNLNNIEEAEFKEHKKKKKKSKKKRNLSERSSMSIDEKQSNDTVSILEHSKDEISMIEKVMPAHNGIAHTDSTLPPNKDNKKNNSNVSERLELNSDSNMKQITVNNSNHMSRKMSERLVVEEDFESYKYNKEDKVGISSKLKKFMKNNTHLKPISNELKNTEIMDDDEIWLVKCPSELECSSFQNKKLTLGDRFKVKLDGHTYEGNTSTVDDRIALIYMKCNSLAISSIPLTGVIHLQRRIPKPHLQDNNIIENNLPEFIPLPTTKCRHPLFGTDFKSCIKIPSPIADKLKSTDCIDSIVKKKKKRKDKDKSINEQKDEDTLVELKEEEQEVNSRKKKKRKTKSEEEEPPRKKKKLKKHTFISPETWDSEKAIEQNLFNF